MAAAAGNGQMACLHGRGSSARGPEATLDTVERHQSHPPQPAAVAGETIVLPPRAQRPGPAAAHRTGRRSLLRWAALVVLLCAAAGGVYWAILPPAVEIVRPHRGPAVQAVYATGTVEPSVMVPIAARSAARLVELRADEGSRVTRGQVLARLENDDLRRAVDSAEAEERYTKAEYDRQSVLVERQVAARSAYDRAKADWEKAKAATARAATEAGFLVLVAPADGLIIKRDGEIGQLIPAN